MRRSSRSIRGYTLIEMVLVVALLAVLAAMAVPSILRDIEQRRLPTSVRTMRALLTLVRANAMYDGKRYRVRFPQEDEIDHFGEDRQPIIEREDDPFTEPNVFTRATEPWVRGETFLRGVWCAEVRLGRPTLEKLRERFLAEQEEDEWLEELEEDFEEGFPPLIIEPDGTSEWVTFVITNAPRDTEREDLEVRQRIEVIMDGLTGLIWLQRPFYDEELDMFEEHGWPPVLRKDFTRIARLTEQDVLEITETAVRR